ncbi:MAG: Bax inhibitor-1/YccA family protein [Alphaproteobacteria bacterium]
MAFKDPFATTMRTTAQAAEMDVGLRSYMLRIYNYMASGLLLTGIVALFTANSPAMLNMLYTQTAEGFGPSGLGYLVMFAPLAFILVMSFGMNRMSVFALQATFWGFAVVMGLSLANIFLAFTGVSVARMFFITAGAFGALSLYGYTTQKDLSGWGSFLFMGLIGIILASLVNLFLASSALQFAISVIGVLVFAGLTAYDTQKLKTIYYQVAGSAEMMAKVSIMGALNLYLDFINMFIMLLQLFGDRR